MKKCLEPLETLEQKVIDELTRCQFELKLLSVVTPHGHGLFEITLKSTEKQLKTVV